MQLICKVQYCEQSLMFDSEAACLEHSLYSTLRVRVSLADLKGLGLG